VLGYAWAGACVVPRNAECDVVGTEVVEREVGGGNDQVTKFVAAVVVHFVVVVVEDDEEIA
jgi:hypothetical protein